MATEICDTLASYRQLGESPYLANTGMKLCAQHTRLLNRVLS